jgi:UDP-N-acetylglucosamine 2-epimerase (hydrolysing)
MKILIIQMGELSSSIFITGSPDVDLILSKNLPSLQDVKKKYEIDFKSYAIALFHPITTDIKNLSPQGCLFKKHDTSIKEFNSK